MSFAEPNTGTQYKVFITPRISDETYGDEVDVSERVRLTGLPSIRKNLDSSDYDFGAFTYHDLEMSCLNSDGFFNDANDSRSMFPYLRDQSKVRVVFFQQNDMAAVTFRGLINDEASRVFVAENTISFRVLSRDSVLNKSDIPTGTITNGIYVSEALFLLMNEDEITRVLNIDIDDINPDFDFAIDVGSAFDGMPKKDAINQLLIASNSVLIIDEDDNVSVTPRTENNSLAPLKLYGPGDLRGRENISALNGYNTGLHRVFNIVSVNDRIQRNTSSITTFGARKKELTFDWITTNSIIDAVAANLLGEFKFPKIELSVTVDTFLAKEYTLLDRVKISYPLQAHPESQFLPILGAFELGDEDYQLPSIVGSVSISENVEFKIIEITEDPRRFQTVLKLRQTGTEFDDGYYA